MREQALAVQRMQDYIDANLDREITLNELAKESLFSPWYSYRLFREYTGLSPAGYIRRLRLSRSALRLRKENLRIIDLAFELGFRSADGYTRAFFREFGCTPKDYAKNPVPIALFIPYGIKFRELRKDRTTMKEVKSVFIQIIRKPQRKVIIKRGTNADDYFTPKAGKAKMEVIDEGDDSKKSYKRLHRWRYSPTVAYGNNEVHLHPYKTRRLSAAEALSLQTLPKEFVLPPEMTLTDKFKTIGNGVPFILSSGIAKTIYDFLEVDE